MKLINIIGTNAIGKSTRVGTFVKYLDSKYTYIDIACDTRNGYKNVGRLYDDKIFLLGKFNKKGVWVSLDAADFSTRQSRHDFKKYMKDTYSPDMFIQEGYFNTGSKEDTLENLKDYGVESYHNYVFVYDNINQFLERTNGRTGKHSRGLDWAEQSSGWRDNARFLKLYEHYHGISDDGCKNTKLDLNTDKDFFVQEFFGENYEIPKEVEW